MHKSIGHRLPPVVAEPLFGKRREFGLIIDPQDSDWLEWERRVGEIYAATQREGVGNLVNDSGYRVMKNISLDNKAILEIGAGDILHQAYWNGRPEVYYLVDRREEFIAPAYDKILAMGVECRKCLLDEGKDFRLNFPDNSVDVIVSFYSLEHLYPLDTYLDEILRVLKKGGKLIGAIPAEGGLAWGLGRYLTSRRWLRKNTSIDYDKLICWEHPNFADEILNQLDKRMGKTGLYYWPLRVPLIDLNLTVSFVYTNNA